MTETVETESIGFSCSIQNSGLRFMVRSPVHYLGFQAKRDNGVRDLEIFNLSLVQNVFSTAQQR